MTGIENLIDECMEELDFEEEVHTDRSDEEEIRLAIRQVLEMVAYDDDLDDLEYSLPNIAGNLNRIEAVSRGRTK